MIDPTFKNAKILIVDDKVANIDVLEGLLGALGYLNFKSTTDPRLVSGLFKTFNPDLILLDLMMPHQNGFEVMEELNSLIPHHSYLPILVLTADITPEAKQRALSGGAKDFISKPFDLIEVGLRIKNLLEARFLHQQMEYQILKLEAANKELEAFSYSVSHDLRAPLRRITGFIQLLKELNTVNRNDQELMYLDVISSGSNEMDKLIEALLSFSRVNHAELRKTTINSLVMVNLVIKSMDQEIQNRDVTFNIGQLYDCKGDEELIKQVWINLVSNAIKYTGKKAKAIIEIGSDNMEHEIIYFVKDNGDGFNMKYVEKLFGVFKRLHKTGDFEGIGIGLANVKRIITRHGGRCSAEGKVGEGATFTFTLPKNT
jgi:signal transduction histidine kinase